MQFLSLGLDFGIRAMPVSVSAPSGPATLTDQLFTHGSGTATIQAAGAFSEEAGTVQTFSVLDDKTAQSIPGIAIHPITGAISIDNNASNTTTGKPHLGRVKVAVIAQVLSDTLVPPETEFRTTYPKRSFEIQRRPAAVDHTASTAAELETILTTIPAATLSGQTIGIDAAITDTFEVPALALTDDLLIVGLTLDADLGGFNITGSVGTATASLVLSLPIREKRVNHSSWVIYNQGAESYVTLRGAEICHGYGPDLDPMDPAVDYPDFTNGDETIVSVGTTSVAVPLQYVQPDRLIATMNAYSTNGDVHFKFSADGTVPATLSDDTTNDNSYTVRYQEIDLVNGGTELAGYVSFIRASGSADITFRTEQGLAQVQATGFGSQGGTSLTFVMDRSYAHSLANLSENATAKHLFRSAFYEIYMDSGFKGGGNSDPNSFQSIELCTFTVGRALAAHPGGPHGDVVAQAYSAADRHNIMIVGNTAYLTNWDVIAQSIFLQDQAPYSGAYFGLIIVGNSLHGGNQNTMFLGANVATGGRHFIAGNTGFRLQDPTSSVTMSMAGDAAMRETCFVGLNIFNAFHSGIVNSTMFSDNHNILTSVDAEGIYTVDGFADMIAARDVHSFLRSRALSTLDAGAEYAQSNWINWGADVPGDALNKAAAPPGILFFDQLDVTAGAEFETAHREVLIAPPEGRSVVLDAGVQIQVWADRTEAVITQSWTTTPPTIYAGNVIALKKAAPATSIATETFGATIDGHYVGQKVTTAVATPAVFFTTGTGTRFRSSNDSVTIGSGKKVIEVSGLFNFSNAVANGDTLFCLHTDYFRVWWSGGELLFSIKKSNGTSVATVDNRADYVFTQGIWNLVTARASFEDGDLIYWIDVNGERLIEGDMINATSADSFFNGQMSIGCQGNAANGWPDGTGVADLSVLIDGVGMAVPPNDATGANAHAWHEGGAVS